MGNQLPSSCNPGSGSSICTSRLQTAVLQPSAVAKVLSLDGQVLHFTKSVKAIHVLLRHPNHCLCPAQSLHLSSHSPLSSPTSPLPLPCSLLPDDELQLGRIYILLPFHTFRIFLSAASAHSRHSQYRLAHPLSASISRKSLAPTRDQQTASIGGQATINQAEPTSSHVNQRQPATSADRTPSDDDCQTQLTSADQAQTTSNQATPSSNQVIYAQPAAVQVQPTPNQPQLVSIQDQTTASNSIRAYDKSQLPPYISQHNPISNAINATAAGPAAPRVHFSNLPPSSAARRSFELQRPHRGAQPDIRRCRSWRPRLQVITEMNTW